MNLFAIVRWTLWQRRWSTFWWSVGSAAFIALVIIAYPPFRDQAAALNQSLDQLPQAVKSLVSDSNDFLSPVGYMSSNAYYLVLPILLGILAISLGSKLIAQDEQDHTIELLLSRPVSRGTLLAGRGVAGLVILGVVTGVTLAATLAFAALIDLGISFIDLTVVTLVTLLIALLFGMATFTLSALGKFGRTAGIGISTLLLVASYLFTSLSGTVHWLRWPAKLLPYNYFHPSEIMTGTIHWTEMGAMVTAVGLLSLIAYIGFRRRDIN